MQIHNSHNMEDNGGDQLRHLKLQQYFYMFVSRLNLNLEVFDKRQKFVDKWNGFTLFSSKSGHC